MKGNSKRAQSALVAFTAILVSIATSSDVTGQAAYRLSGPATCPSCRIEKVLLVEIDDSSAPGSLLDHAFAHATRDGRFFVVSQLRELYITDRNGKIARRVGNEGQGPGEYREPLYTLETDSFFVVLDSRNWRNTFLRKADLSVARTSRLHYFPLSAPLFIGGNRIALNASLGGLAKNAHHPIHIVNMDGTIVRSFGADLRTTTIAPTSKTMTRAVSSGRNGTIWVAYPHEYRIEKWDTAGRLISVFTREVDWFKPRSASVSARDLPVVLSVREDQAGLLWVEIAIIKPAGTAVKFPFDHSNSELYVEVIAPEKRSVVAATRLKGFIPFPGMGGLFNSTFSARESGDPLLNVWTYALRR